MIPDQIRESARQSRARARPVTLGPATGQPGELGVAHSRPGARETSPLARVVAVVGADDTMKTVTVELATNEVEHATDLDLVVGPGDAGTPFAMAIQSELYGPLFADQLDGVVGRLDEKRLHAVANALLTDGESLDGLPTGSPFGGSDDPRRSFKERELRDLEDLTIACRIWLDGAAAADAVIDPLLLIPPPTGTARDLAEDRFLELLDTVEALGDGPIEIPSEFLASADEFLDELLRWRLDFGLDASRVLSRVRVTEIGGEVGAVAQSASGEFTRDDASVVLVSYLTACAGIGRLTVDIHSVPRCWGNRTPVVVAAVGPRYCRGRARLPEAA